MDGGCKVEGYESDISRTVVLGKPSDKMKKIFDMVHKAQSTALATARPGVPCEAVDAAARKVISDAGYGPDYAHFGHRVGHGIGMDGHEWPYLVRGNKTPLAPRMCFSDEPGVYCAVSSVFASKMTCTSLRTALNCSHLRARAWKIRSGSKPTTATQRHGENLLPRIHADERGSKTSLAISPRSYASLRVFAGPLTQLLSC